MSIELSNLNKAGRLLKLIGWLLLLATIGIAAAILIPAYNSGDTSNEIYAIYALITLSFVFSMLYLIVGSAIKHNKKWAKITGAVISALSLLSVPIGTVLGVSILYYLHKGWHEPQETT